MANLKENMGCYESIKSNPEPKTYSLPHTQILKINFYEA